MEKRETRLPLYFRFLIVYVKDAEEGLSYYEKLQMVWNSYPI
jgi:hypothetical protein